MAFTNGTHGGTAWLGSELSTLVNRLLGVPDEVIRTNVPQRPEVWGDLCGWYYLPDRSPMFVLEQCWALWRCSSAVASYSSGS